MMMMMVMMRLQAEGAALRTVMSAGVPTQVVVIGITNDVNETELQSIASPPISSNVILVPGFPNLGSIEQQLVDQCCNYGR